MKKILIAMLLIFAIFLSGCSQLSPAQNTPLPPTQDTSTEPLPEKTSFTGYAYRQLNTEEQGLYKLIYAGLATEQEEFSEGLEAYDSSLIEIVYQCVIADFPELFWAANGYHVNTKTSGSEKTVTLTPEYNMTAQAAQKAQKELDTAIEAFAKAAQSCESDYEKAIFAHDFLVNSVEYDEAAFEAIISGNKNQGAKDASNAYGALVNKKAICSGYAQAYQLLLSRLGVETLFVAGSKNDGSEHAWNLVFLDGEGYYVDVTFDDPLSNGDGDNLSYNYFCITEKQLLKTHTISNPFALPDCTATACNYFVKNGLVVESYTLSAIEKIISDAYALGKNKAMIKFTSAALMQKACGDLFENSKIFDVLPDSEATNVNYLIDDENFVLTVYI